MEKILNEQNFDEFTGSSDKPLLVDFWAEWCGPCKMIAPHLEKISETRGDIVVCKVNVDEAPSLAAKFGIRYIPTLIVMKDSREIKRDSGYKSPDEIAALIESAL